MKLIFWARVYNNYISLPYTGKKMQEINKHPKENEDKEIGRYDRVVGNYYINIFVCES